MPILTEEKSMRERMEDFDRLRQPYYEKVAKEAREQLIKRHLEREKTKEQNKK